MDQTLVAAIALVVFAALVVAAYIAHCERRGKARYSTDPTEDGRRLLEEDRRETPETRSRRAF